MHTPLAQKTIHRVTSALEETGEAAALSEIVQLIQELSSTALNISVNDLAHIIGKDVVVTSKVIIAANTLGFNPTNSSVSTLSEAIQVIGFNKIRQLALSLLLVENAERTLNPLERQEIAALALCSGMIAETVMSRHGTFPVEQAFICASLRCYGRLLMTTFMLDEYRRALYLIHEGGDEDEVFNKIFGLTPLELGHHLLATAHLPEPILKSLNKVPPDVLKRAAQQPDVELLALSDLCVKLTEYALRTDISKEHFNQHLVQLAQRNGRLFGLTAEDLLQLLTEADAQLKSFSKLFGLQGITHTITPRLETRIYQQDPRNTSPSLIPPAPPTKTADTPPSPILAIAAETTPAPAPIAPINLEDAFDSATIEISSLLDEATISMGNIYNALIKATLAGFHSQNCLLLVRSAPGRPFSCDYGTGELFLKHRGTALLSISDRNVFGLSLSRLEDVIINDATDPRIQQHLPAWLRQSNLASMILFPVHESKKPFAVLIVGWPEKRTEKFSSAELLQIRAVLRLVGAAHRLDS